MNPQLQQLLDRHGGVVPWATACAEVSSGVVEWASRTGRVTLPYPGVLADPSRDDLRLRAALLCAGPGATLSHTSALEVWRLPAGEPGETVHVVTGPGRRIRVAGIAAHRRAGFVTEPPSVVVRDGLPVTGLDPSLVDSWPLLAGAAQRAPLITAVAERMTTPARIDRVLASAPRLPQRLGLRRLLDLLAAGCRSPLELWGYGHVFAGPPFERLRWQVPVVMGRRRLWLDAFDEESATNFELDGRAYHASDRDRERDVRRDAALAARGIQAVRFTHARLHGAVDEVRREALETIAIRSGMGRLVDADIGRLAA